MNEKGAPSPVAWTRLRAPQGSMAPTPADQMLASVNASPLLPTYGTPIDRQSAYELLSTKMNAAAQADAQVEADKAAAAEAREQKKIQAEYDKAVRDMRRTDERPKTTTRTRTRQPDNPIGDILGSRTGQTVIREVLRGIFSTLKRK